MRTVDRFEVEVDPQRYMRWPEGGGFQPVTLRINGIELIERHMVIGAELVTTASSALPTEHCVVNRASLQLPPRRAAVTPA